MATTSAKRAADPPAAPTCPCGAPATAEVVERLGLFCQKHADQAQAGLKMATERIRWSPTPELARASALETDRSLSGERLGAVRRARDLERWAAEAAEILSRPDVPESDLKKTMHRVDTWWAQTLSEKLREGAKVDAAYELVVFILEAIRTSPRDGWQHDADWVIRSAEPRWPEYASTLDRQLLEQCVAGHRPKWTKMQELLVKAGLRPALSSATELRTGLYRWLDARGSLGQALRRLLRIAPDP